MFLPARSFTAGLCSSGLTYYKREEHASMRSGKLDEELRRMSEIIDHFDDDALMLFNESFAATNEREGTEIARQIVGTLLDQVARMFFVTHMFEFSKGLAEDARPDLAFLRAERREDGSRSFGLIEASHCARALGRISVTKSSSARRDQIRRCRRDRISPGGTHGVAGSRVRE